MGRAYSACHLKSELIKMREWLLANPDKKKKNYRRFIINWLIRTQDRGGTKENMVRQFKNSRSGKFDNQPRTIIQ